MILLLLTVWKRNRERKILKIEKKSYVFSTVAVWQFSCI